VTLGDDGFRHCAFSSKCKKRPKKAIERVMGTEREIEEG
jgi:hypothetical protein